MNPGILYAVAAYLLWGVSPVYFKALQNVPAPEILAHRMAWSLLVCGLLLLLLRRWQWVAELARRPRLLATFATTAALVTVNWGLYIWAINANHVVDASLGYFINPLVNVLIGAFVLHERLRRSQWTAAAIAAAGVVWLTWDAGRLPWIGLALAITWAIYGLQRKTTTLGAIEGLAVETTLLFPLAMTYLLWLAAQGQSSFAGGSTATQWLLAAAGPVTATPLLLFTASARRIPFAHLGILQYISPTLQLLLGVWLFHEPFSASKAVGYGLIWLALALFAVDGLWQWKLSRA
ncbi:MAG: EamA family transporter RarD [Gemmatimonadota bacterium]